MTRERATRQWIRSYLNWHGHATFEELWMNAHGTYTIYEIAAELWDMCGRAVDVRRIRGVTYFYPMKGRDV